MLRIAIIDDEINTELLLKNNQIQKVWIDPNILSLENDNERITHSTVIARIIEGYSQNSIEYELINIIAANYNDHYFSSDFFIKALKYSIKIQPDILLLSVGTTFLCDVVHMSPVISKIVTAGTLIVSAISNENKITFPAYFNNVIAVRLDTKKRDNISFWRAQKDVLNTDFVVSYSETDLCKYANIDTYPSNSFAVPFLLAKIMGLIEKNGEYDVETRIVRLRKYCGFPTRNFNCDYVSYDECINFYLVNVIVKNERYDNDKILASAIRSLYKKYGVTSVYVKKQKKEKTCPIYFPLLEIKMDTEEFMHNKYYKNIDCDLIFVENAIPYDNGAYEMTIKMLTDNILLCDGEKIVWTFNYTKKTGDDLAYKIIEISS